MEHDIEKLSETCNRNLIRIRQEIKLIDNINQTLYNHLINVTIEREAGRLIKLSTFDNRELEEYNLWISDDKLKIIKNISCSERTILNHIINLNELEEKLKLMFGLTLDF